MGTFGLTLGGGGARGSAHIGVLLEMERLNLKPDLITGTSIGGVLGSLMASGLGVDAMTDFMTELRVVKAYEIPRQLSSLTNNTILEKLLVKTIGRPKFSDLQLPFAVVAASLNSQSQVVINNGDVISAVLATAAIPSILPPIERDGEILIDGGVLNNTPFDIALEMGATKTLAVDLSNAAPYGTKVGDIEEGSLLDKTVSKATLYPSVQIITATLDLMQAHVLQKQLEVQPPDVILRPDLGTIGMLDFHRLQEGIEVGRKAFLSAENEIKEKLC